MKPDLVGLFFVCGRQRLMSVGPERVGDAGHLFCVSRAFQSLSSIGAD